MRPDDARKLDHATLEAMRVRAVRSVQAGESPEVVARSLRINPRTMYGWHPVGSQRPGVEPHGSSQALRRAGGQLKTHPEPGRVLEPICARRRTQDVEGRRNTISPTCRRRLTCAPWPLHQGAMDLRAGAPAAERRTRSRSLRGPILARTASACTDDDRLRLPPISSAPASAKPSVQQVNAIRDAAR
jgi:hypothetical protein